MFVPFRERVKTFVPLFGLLHGLVLMRARASSRVSHNRTVCPAQTCTRRARAGQGCTHRGPRFAAELARLRGEEPCFTPACVRFSP